MNILIQSECSYPLKAVTGNKSAYRQILLAVRIFNLVNAGNLLAADYLKTISHPTVSVWTMLHCPTRSFLSR